jgi:hypothetical protein
LLGNEVEAIEGLSERICSYAPMFGIPSQKQIERKNHEVLLSFYNHSVKDL